MDKESRNRAERRHPRAAGAAEELWKLNQAAAYLSCTERHLRELIYRREVPYLKVGRLVRFRRSELDQWLESNRTVVVG